MRIGIAGFYGWGNSGDEGILLSIIDSLGSDNEYLVSTTLPFNLAEEYRRKLPLCVEEVRQIYDTRTDYDVYLLGGGGLDWGFGWRQCFAVFLASVPCMNYGVGYSNRSLYDDKLKPAYREFLANFNAITVRDERSLNILTEIGLNPALTMCPAINLEEEKFNCPEGRIAVCPRYEDLGSNELQINWFIRRLEGLGDEVLLIPFAPHDKQGHRIDLELCSEIAKKIPGSRILKLDGYSPRKVKYAISKSKLVISGGRLHALVWAASHNIPFEVSPMGIEKIHKIGAFIEMHEKYGNLKELERRNKEILLENISERFE